MILLRKWQNIFLLTLQSHGPNDISVIFEVKRIFAKSVKSIIKKLGSSKFSDISEVQTKNNQ